jgi:hypothetical protein
MWSTLDQRLRHQPVPSDRNDPDLWDWEVYDVVPGNSYG